MTVQGLGTQPPEVVDSFRKHYASIAAPGAGRQETGQTNKRPEDVPVGFDETDVLEGDLLSLLLGGDGGESESAGLAKTVSDAIAKRGATAVQQSLASFSAAKRARRV